MKTLVLGSSSPFRKKLLEKLQIPFLTASPDIDETALPNETAEQLVRRLSIAKAQAVAKKYPDALIIGSDQVGVVNGEVFGKPLTHENAVKQLQTMSGSVLCFYIGLCLLDAKSGEQQVCVETFTVKLRELSLATIENYLAKEQPYQSAGSIKAEGLGIALFESTQGNDPNAIIGLPLIQLVTMLKKVDVEIL